MHPVLFRFLLPTQADSWCSSLSITIKDQTQRVAQFKEELRGKSGNKDLKRLEWLLCLCGMARWAYGIVKGVCQGMIKLIHMPPWSLSQAQPSLAMLRSPRARGQHHPYLRHDCTGLTRWTTGKIPHFLAYQSKRYLHELTHSMQGGELQRQITSLGFKTLCTMVRLLQLN